MNIRPIERTDERKVADLIYHTWEKHVDMASGFLKREYLESIDIKAYLDLCLASDTNFMFVAEEEGNIIGCCRIEIKDAEPMLIHSRLAYFHDVIVDEKHQREHIATALLQAIEPFMKKLGVNLLKTRLYTFNEAAQGLFTKEGFKNLYSEFYKKLD